MKYMLVQYVTKMAVGQPAVCQASLYSALPSVLHTKFSLEEIHIESS